MKILTTFLVVSATLIISGCGSSELESRVTKLEGRVATLEGKGIASTGSVSNTSQPQVTSVSNDNTLTEKPEGPLPDFKFSEELHDFGEIKEGDVVEHIFSFTNTGEAPLIISDVKATCGCTVPEWPKEEIPVGSTGEIKVKFNSKGRSGIQNKTVTLTANTWPNTKTHPHQSRCSKIRIIKG